ncbi:protein GLUTAMINE DUMPER 2-like [Punica granatum]|uniref:Protein GLUTAMINE DUMPER 2-like n=1 Tax=Punica granatum TaxID=22663 RepID=A0A218XIE9_PUNGR|nr:protein GLUTAMINE DUMPER 2-like [Punica granatum]OWM84694.1 hypothetical protein CDL15_Pgr027481 [Punica granatum]
MIRSPANDDYNYSTAKVAAAAVDSGLTHFNTPVPYLYGALALLLGVISAALIILACSRRKSATLRPLPPGSSSGSAATEGLPEMMDGEVGPKIVVIMAGDDKPTYLAKPVVSSSSHKEQV